MPTVTVTRNGRTWLVLPAYSVTIADATGRITFDGYRRREAYALAAAVGSIVGDHPVGSLANVLAREIAHCEPKPGETWTVRL